MWKYTENNEGYPKQAWQFTTFATFVFQVVFGVLFFQQLYNPVLSKERDLDHFNRAGGK